jgi:hypothetical protein
MYNINFEFTFIIVIDEFLLNFYVSFLNKIATLCKKKVEQVLIYTILSGSTIINGSVEADS